jgi:MoaA/NifB/PqqE/SkfB family radical SAM enzyme
MAASAPTDQRMSPRTWATLAGFGLSTVLLRRTDPIVGSLIVTDRCNLACAHCAVANIRRVDYPFARLAADLQSMREQGARILFLYGGEPFLWRDGDLRLVDVVAEARRLGYLLVNAVTNGTRGLDLPGADLLLVSLDGTREHHDRLRGRSYDRVLAHIEAAPRANICLYMAVNSVNLDDIGHVCRLAQELPNARAVSFNLHTPYPGTEHLMLSPAQRRAACEAIAAQIDAGMPVMNMPSVLPLVAAGTAPRPCPQCIIVEDGQQWTCGRCIEIPGLCQECGFLFASELSMLFRGHPRVVLDALRMYRNYL